VRLISNQEVRAIALWRHDGASCVPAALADHRSNRSISPGGGHNAALRASQLSAGASTSPPLFRNEDWAYAAEVAGPRAARSRRLRLKLPWLWTREFLDAVVAVVGDEHIPAAINA
jgi:hypothetical protein